MRRKKSFSHISIIIDLDDKRKEGKRRRKEGSDGVVWGGEPGGNDWFTAC